MPKTKKFSAKRSLILEAVNSTDTHPGVQWLYGQIRKKYPRLSIATVYRTIREACEEGDIVSRGVVNGEERFDAATSPHPHAVCKICGKIRDIPERVPADPDEGSAFGVPGFSCDRREAVYYGVCDACAASASSSRPLAR
jgi:Fur family peroxide stress response transcriptional regulator